MDAYSVEPEIADIRARARAKGAQRLVFVAGNFNVVHPGHLRLLKFAAEVGDFLVVGINPDNTPGVTIPASLRADGVQAIGFVDYGLILNEAPEHFIAKLQPDIVVKGKEYEQLYNAELPVLESYGGKLVFGSGEVSFSSIGLLHREYFEMNLSSIVKPRDYPLRYQFDVGDLKQALRKFAGMRVLVVGDLIVDEYIDCDPLGMSQEDPTLVVTPISSRSFIGGAGIVAAHASGLGANVEYVTVAGADAIGEYARQSFPDLRVNAEIFIDETRPTTRKQRFRAHNKTLLRINHLRQHAIALDLAEQMAREIERRLPHVDLLLFADFNYGCLPQQLVGAVAEMAAQRNIMMAADSQASSQLGDISRFKDMSLITPTEREARLALRDFESGLVIVAQQLQETARADNVVLTLGSEGVLVHGRQGGEFRNDRLPAFNTSAKDPAGAGDSFFTCTALALRAGVDIWQGAYLGSLAAACQVSRVGNMPLSSNDIVVEIDYPTG